MPLCFPSQLSTGQAVVMYIMTLCFRSQVFHLEDIVEQTGYVLEKDSEYSQKILEEEEEVSVSVTQKGGKTSLYQVTIFIILEVNKMVTLTYCTISIVTTISIIF